MSTLTLASDPRDAAAVEAVEAHHAQLAGQLAGRVAMLLDAADRDPAAADRARAGLVAFCDRELLPHAAAEESALYPAAHRTAEARLLVDGMLAEHRRIGALVEALRAPLTPARAAADARALQVLFEEHLDKENDLVLPLIAAAPDVSLAGLLAGMHELLGGHEESGGTGRDGEEGGCGGGCACGETDAGEAPELDVREVPHAIRHATVFGALEAVPAGRSMVLVAPHDPLPLLAQIEQRTSGAFAVEYLERGPQAWRLRLTHR
ncbi:MULTISPECIES: DUF2249 domain-containing protein [Streptomyces]|uniref:Uncharacterized conserved protein, DUF2249 family n=1 Tax=Streptomyces pini TaxID=1520580 RepID=A0A1I4A2V2_9ACTN|nr:DUF2249 domain-containing protein [Streptomyces pini]SFK50427.1 Uncharacterized conserved protein, DUF2249 family [Streptomyces pini]